MKIARQKSLFGSILIWCTAGAIAGLAVGFYSHYRKAPEYQSAALVLIGQLSDRSDVDDSSLIVGRPTVELAIEQSRLDLLVDLGTEKESQRLAAMRLAKSGGLAARRVETTSQGQVYEISFRSHAPSISRQVVQAIVVAGKKTLGNSSENVAWEQAIDLLSDARESVNARIDTLSEELRQVELEQRAIPLEGELSSVASVQWKLLQQSFEGERQLQFALRERVNEAEEQLSKGVPEDEILLSLARPVTVQAEPQDSEKNRRAQKALAPLEAQLERALRRYGRQHPTIVSIQREIDAVRDQFGLGSPSPLAVTEISSAGWSTAGDGVEYLKDQMTKSDQRLAQLLEELDLVAVTMASENRLSRRETQLRELLARESQFQEQILRRLEQLPAASPFPQTSYSVLRAADDGTLVSPNATQILAIGCITGIIAGLGVGALSSLGKIMGVREEPDETTQATFGIVEAAS